MRKKIKKQLDKTVDYISDIAEPSQSMNRSIFNKKYRLRADEQYRQFINWCEDCNPFIMSLLVVISFVLAGVILALSITLF